MSLLYPPASESQVKSLCSIQVQHFFHLSVFLTREVCVCTLLDFAVILQLLTVKKYSKIPYIWFTVNYCNTHCIMGISVLILQ